MIPEEIRLYRLFHRTNSIVLQKSQQPADNGDDEGKGLLEQMSFLLSEIEAKWQQQKILKVISDAEYANLRNNLREYHNSIRDYELKLLGEPRTPKRFFDAKPDPSDVDEDEELMVIGNADEDNEGKIHEQLQSEFTDGMVSMVRGLKENAKQIGEIARDDVNKIGDIVGHMDARHIAFKKINTKLKELTGKYGSMCLFQICAIMVVLCVFMSMFIFMKIFPKRKYTSYSVTNTGNIYSEDTHDESGKSAVIVEMETPVNSPDVPESDNVAQKVEDLEENSETVETLSNDDNLENISKAEDAVLEENETEAEEQSDNADYNHVEL